MKAYDKILLALAVLILAGAIGFYVMRSGTVAKADALLNQQPSGPDYQAVEPPEVIVDKAVWRDPIAKDSRGVELYDIFTPPKIYWDPLEGIFRFEPVVPPEPPTPFGLELVSIERELFRIQLEGFFLAPDGTMENSLVQFYNARLGESVRGKMGETFPEHGFKVIAVENKRVIENVEGSTTIRRVPTVVIQDLEQDGRAITLTTESKLFLEGELSIVMETADPYPRASFTWQTPGDTYFVDNATFTLMDIDLDNKSVRVEKSSPDLESPETETLRQSDPATNNIEETPPATDITDQDSDMPDVFDNFFN